MTTVCERRLAAALKIMVPSDDLIAPGFFSFGRESALAQTKAAFLRINRVCDS